MTEDNRDAEPVAALEDCLYRPELEGLRKKLEQVGRWRRGMRAFLDEIAEQSGILGPHDGPDADWRFWHRTFREALTAERPPEELFRWVETPRDGTIELWKTIPAGAFWMGSPEGESEWKDERPRHQVTIASPFRIGAVPVTLGQYLLFDPGHRSFFEGQLPAEEEWEYACRAGTETRYWKGDEEKDLADIGWYSDNSEFRTHRVGEKEPNRWGLYDMHGSVWAWTLSPMTGNYAGREGGHTHDPETPPTPVGAEATHSAWRVVRGGSYFYGADWAPAASRKVGDTESDPLTHGFRVVIPGAPEPGG